MTDNGRWGLVALSLAAIMLTFAASLAVGDQIYGWEQVRAAFSDTPGEATIIIREVRIPRAFLAMVVGLALAVAGSLTQTLTRNPLADPGLLGVTAGAGFAVSIGAALGLAAGQFQQMVWSFLGAAITAAAVYLIGREAPLRMVLAGVAISAVIGGISLGLRLMKPDVFEVARVWAVGSVAGREQTPMAWPIALMVLGLIGAALVCRPLSSVALGEDVAQAMGVNVPLVRLVVFGLVTLLAGTATAAAGPLAFVGLIVPALARRVAAGSVAWLLGFTALWGAVLLLLSDMLGRVLLPTGEVPLSVVTAFLGGFALIAVVREGPAR
ncbi:FecCD family ABC transporter permease [Dermacoccaceae bacterium W4C1]